MGLRVGSVKDKVILEVRTGIAKITLNMVLRTWCWIMLPNKIVQDCHFGANMLWDICKSYLRFYELYIVDTLPQESYVKLPCSMLNSNWFTVIHGAFGQYSFVEIMLLDRYLDAVTVHL